MTDHLSPEIALCFCRSMRRASNRLIKLYTTALAPCGLKPIEFALLAEIKSRRAPTLIELADVFQSDRYTLRYKLGLLEKAGLVEMSPDDRDARTRRATATPKGLAKLDAATPLWLEAQGRIESAMGSNEAASMRSVANLLASTTIADAKVASN